MFSTLIAFELILALAILTVKAAIVKRDLYDDASSALSVAISDLSSVQSRATPYISSALSEATSYASSALSVAQSDCSSALSDASTWWYGDGSGQDTSLVNIITTFNNVRVTEVSSVNGPVITLAPGGQGTPTTFGGHVFTIATVAPSGGSDGSNSGDGANNGSGMKATATVILMFMLGFTGWFLL